MKILKYTSKRGKFEESWLSKSLEMLEGDNWGEIPKDESYLITTCYKLRKKPLNEFETEDLRILIGQDLGLKYLIPLALQILEKDILDEGHFYEGDLLKSVLTSNNDYWEIEREDWEKMVRIFNDNKDRIEKEAQEYDTGRKIIEAFNEFKKKAKNVHNNV